MKLVCGLDECTGCMACVDACSKNAVTIKDTLLTYNAVIDEKLCVDCGQCHKVCQNLNTIGYTQPKWWNEGWALSVLREQGSSGGMATAIAKTFIKNGGVVYSCVLEKGKFGFTSVARQEDLLRFAGSKYVKSDLSGNYDAIKKTLLQQQKVLFIGLPCQVEAVKLYVGERLQQNLFTIDLICHGTPSPKLLKLFLEEHYIDLSQVQDIKFRISNQFQLFADYKEIVTVGTCDKYSIGFLNGLFYTENCYHCKFAKKERVSDITLGDSWGSELSADEQDRGISLVITQTEKGRKLLDNEQIYLKTVDAQRAIANNHQLKAPSEKPKQSAMFFEKVQRGCSFSKAVFYCLPKQCMRQKIKAILIQSGLIKLRETQL